MKLRLLFTSALLAPAVFAQTWTVSTPTTHSTGTASYSVINVTSTLTQSGGTLSATTGLIGEINTERRFELTNGSATFGDLILAPYRGYTLATSYGTLVMSGGTLSATNLILSDTSGSYQQSRVYHSGGTLTAGSVRIGTGSGNNSAYYLDGTGILATGGITTTGSPAHRLLYMNGGTIRATASNDNFINSAITAMVGGNGVTLDTNGHDIGYHGGFTRDPDDPNLGVVTKSGSGTLTLYADSTFTGGYRLNGGTLAVSTHDKLGPAAAPLTFNGGLLRVTSTAIADFGARSFNASTFNGGIDVAVTDHTFTIGQALSGSGTFTKAGVGTVVLSGANTLAGATVSTGTLKITGSFTGNIANNAALAFDRGTDLTYAGVVSGTGSLTKDGANTLTLSGVNTHTGGTIVTAGTLRLTTGGQLGAIRGHLTINAGATVENAVANAVGWGTGTKVTHLTLNGGTFHNTAANGAGTAIAYTLNGGSLISNDGVSSTTADSRFVADSFSSFQVGGAATSTISGRMDLRADGGSPNVNFTVAAGATLRVSAGISSHTTNNVPGPVGFTKLGAGTMTLTGTNTYTGATAVSAGTLIVNGSSAASAFSVANGATLAGSGTVGTLTLAGTLAPGNSPGTLSAGNTTFADDGIFAFELNNATGAAGTNWDQLAITGSLTLTATSANPFILELTSLTLANTAGLAANFDSAADYAFTFVTTTTGITGFSADKFSIDTTAFTNPFNGSWSVGLTNGGNDLALNYTGTTAIPEPSTYAMITGLLIFAVVAIRRRK